MTSDRKRSVGRPPDPNAKQMISARVTREVREFLRSQENASQWIDAAVRRSKDFRDWDKARER